MKFQLKHQPVITHYKYHCCRQTVKLGFREALFSRVHSLFSGLVISYPNRLQKESFVKTFKCFEKCLSYVWWGGFVGDVWVFFVPIHL